MKKRQTTTHKLDDATAACLSEALKLAPLPPETRERMRARVLGSTRQPYIDVVRAGEGEWRLLLPGIMIKILRCDQRSATQTSLLRLSHGACVPPHTHIKDEECLVLEGHVVHGDMTYSAGDFLFTRAGVRHLEFITPQGALLFIRGELVQDAVTPKQPRRV